MTATGRRAGESRCSSSGTRLPATRRGQPASSRPRRSEGTVQEPQPLAKCERGRRPRQHVETAGSHGFSDGRSHELARRVLDSGDPQLDRPQPGLLLATSHPLRGMGAPPARPGAWASKRSLSSHRTSAWGMNRALERDGVSTGHRPDGRFEAAIARPMRGRRIIQMSANLVESEVADTVAAAVSTFSVANLGTATGLRPRRQAVGERVG